LSQLKLKKPSDEVEIVENEEDTDAFAVYYADVNKNLDREPIYNAELGLAIEKLREGLTIQSLWQVVHT
jgi:Bardet-Biedl syndrome 5 protein